MKQTFLILVSAICIVAAYGIGRESTADADTQAISEQLTINANGILAYEHYFECAEVILKDVTIKDTLLSNELALAKQQLEEYYTNHVMTWPEIIDQRDKLSDIIRIYADTENNNIMNYVRQYFDDPTILNGWAYSYESILYKK